MQVWYGEYIYQFKDYFSRQASSLKPSSTISDVRKSFQPKLFLLYFEALENVVRIVLREKKLKFS